jgi:hypothetical protein
MDFDGHQKEGHRGFTLCHVGEKGTNPEDSQVTNSLFLVYFLFAMMW